MIFELLFYNGLYLGFVLFEMGSSNLPIYDILRTILSPSLYRAIIINKKVESGREQKLLLQNLKINQKQINFDVFEKSSDNSAVTTHKILEYLLNHINDPTDLEKISQDFNLSVSSLVRKAKKLTGFSIQKLHELLKIEKAKLLLENKVMNISEISNQLGYQNQYYFSSVFKKCS
jgi:AraC-like DNA-binding protein